MAFYSELPYELVHDIGQGKCVVFLGAGVSKRCLGKGRMSLPNWTEFLKSFCNWQHANGKISKSTVDESELLLSRNKHLMVAEELLETSTEDEFSNFLNDSFEPKLIAPSILHHLVVALPFRAIITSNYDNLVEQAFYSAFKRWPKVFNHRDIAPGCDLLNHNFFVLKIHGDIGDPRSIVLGHKSYADLLYNSQEYREFLERLFCEYSVLFLGYGGTDPDIDALYDKLLATRPAGHRMHYMLSLKDSMTGIEKRRLLQDRSIKVIEYVDSFGLHNHIDTFLFDVGSELVKVGVSLNGPLPQKFRSRAYVVYDQVDAEDGSFVRDYIFKLGAVTTVKGADTYSDFVGKFD